MLQQLEVPHDATVSVNDCLRPVSRFYERVERPEQLIPAALEAMRVLTDPAETGAVTLAMPEDVQAEAFAVPTAFLQERTWTLYRQPPAPEAVHAAASVVRAARRPLIVAGGGVIYSEATEALRAFVDATGIPVAETQAGRGALLSDHPLSLGAVGATGTSAANALAREADVVIGIGTRWSDFTTASKSAFQDAGVRFINVNVTGFDAAKLSGVAVVADAAEALGALSDALDGYRVPDEWHTLAARAQRRLGRRGGTARVDPWGRAPLPGPGHRRHQRRRGRERNRGLRRRLGAGRSAQAVARPRPGRQGYHIEYGYSCMGYEIPGAMGVKLAAPERPVFVLIGDGSYLMMPGELVTAVAERIPIVIVLVDNHGYASIGALSRSVGSAGFGTHYRFAANGSLPVDDADGDGLAQPAGADVLPVDLAANAESLGARVIRASTIDDLRAALAQTDDMADAAPPWCASRPTATPGCPATRAGGTCLSRRSRPRSRCAPPARNTSATHPPNDNSSGEPMSDLVMHPATGPAADGTFLTSRLPRRAGPTSASRCCASRRAWSPTATRATVRCASWSFRDGHRQLRARRVNELGGRPDPWSGPPDAAYLPPGTPFRSPRPTRPRWPCAGRRRRTAAPRARVLPGDEIEVEIRGYGSQERTVRPILMADQEADSLLVVEVLTPGGNWSSYPPHKHDHDNPPTETFLEETYYHRVTPAQGFGLQRVYSQDRSLDETLTFGDRDCVLVPRGYHTVSAPPGYDVYYLNVMAGPKRQWAFVNDPDHEWRAAPSPAT